MIKTIMIICFFFDGRTHTQAPATEENVALLGAIEQRKIYLHVFAVARRRDKRAKMVETSVRTIATAKGKRSETGFKSWEWMCREHGEKKHDHVGRKHAARDLLAAVQQDGGQGEGVQGVLE